MSVKVKPIPDVRPELLELKEDIISRIPPVKAEDAIKRIEEVLNALTSETIDVPRTALDFGLDFSGLDVQKTAGFVSLYKKANSYKPYGISVTTVCLGLKPVEGDPLGSVKPHWVHRDYPEEEGGDVIYVPSSVYPKREKHPDAVTYSAKYHIIIPKGNKPFMFIYPVQSNSPDDLPADKLKALVERAVEAGDKEAMRELEYRTSGLESNSKFSAFRHRDRYLLMGLAGLMMARSLGIDDVRLPPDEFVKNETNVWYTLKFKLSEEEAEKVTLIGNYRKLEDFLQKSGQFTTTEWEGKEPDLKGDVTF
ncbi:MAG: hypothetical protein V1744_02780 [Candidatus Altiarchaeota archaeon]